jgi:hypothetical protein
MIKSAIGKNLKIYCLGRSTRGSGVHQYKQQWPVEEQDLYFSVINEGGFSIRKLGWLSTVWKRIPAFVADGAGPFFARRMY